MVFFTLFAFTGKALLQKLLERKRLNKESGFKQSRERYRIKSVTPVSRLETPRDSVNESDVMPAILDPSDSPEKHVTFETAATRDKEGLVKTIIIRNHESGII